jgi:hypothetical protein
MQVKELIPIYALTGDNPDADLFLQYRSIIDMY